MQDQIIQFLSGQGIERLTYDKFWKAFGGKFSSNDAEALQQNPSLFNQAVIDPLYYDFIQQQSKFYDIMVGAFEDITKTIEDYLVNHDTVVVVDAGTATGLLPCYLAQQFGERIEVQGFDFNSDMLEIALARAARMELPNTKFYFQDLLTPDPTEFGVADILAEKECGVEDSSGMETIFASIMRVREGGLIISSGYSGFFTSDQVAILERNGLVIEKSQVIATTSEQYRNIHLRRI